MHLLRPRSLLTDRSGAAALEFGLLAPVLFALLAGTIDMGQGLYQHHVLTKVARDAARFLARAPTPDATWETRARNVALYGTVDGSGTPLSTTIQISFTYGATGSPTTFYGSPQVITAVVEQPFNPFTGFFFNGQVTIAARHQERHIGS